MPHSQIVGQAHGLRPDIGTAEAERFAIPLYREPNDVGWNDAVAMFLVFLPGS